MKPIRGFPGYYVEWDKIYSFWKRTGKGYGRGTKFTLGETPTELKTFESNGYLCLTLYDKDRTKSTQFVHRLVATAYWGKRPKNKQVCHNNGIKTDNRPENLRWDTCKKNNKDKIKHGTNHGPKGELSGHAKLKDEDVIHIKKALVSGISRRKLAEKYKITVHTIGKIARGERWSHVLI